MRARRGAPTRICRPATLAQVLTTLLAWTTVAAACLAAGLFGRTARSAGAPGAVPLSTRVGLALSSAGPWSALALGLLVAALTGAWTTVPVLVLGTVVLVAVLGLVLAPL